MASAKSKYAAEAKTADDEDNFRRLDRLEVKDNAVAEKEKLMEKS